MILRNGAYAEVMAGDCLESLKSLPEQMIQTCVTSPPYFGLRSYDEGAVTVNPKLHKDTQKWVEDELERRGIYAR